MSKEMKDKFLDYANKLKARLIQVFGADDTEAEMELSPMPEKPKKETPKPKQTKKVAVVTKKKSVSTKTKKPVKKTNKAKK